MKHIISLGAGVQSSTMALLAAHGEIEPMPELAIFADTQWEPAAVYAWLDYLETLLPFPVVRVTAGNIREDQVSVKGRGGGLGRRGNCMPYFVDTPNGGISTRQCTENYKIAPIERYLRREVLGLKPRQRAPKEVKIIQWRGISTDEASRMKPSREPWFDVRYPLAMELRMSRQDCLQWMARNGYSQPPRSACIGCPFHSNHEWRRMRKDEPLEWQDAVQFDAAIRHAGGMERATYLHRSCVPLAEVDLDTPEDRGQRDWINECEGMCGV